MRVRGLDDTPKRSGREKINWNVGKEDRPGILDLPVLFFFFFLVYLVSFKTTTWRIPVGVSSCTLVCTTRTRMFFFV